jgi:uncharacterized membrane protein YbhN (UPF0104 family)
MSLLRVAGPSSGPAPTAAASAVAGRSTTASLLRRARLTVGVLVLLLAVWWLATSVEWQAVPTTLRAVAASPGAVLLALLAYAAAFALRAGAWSALQPELPRRHAWAAIHVSLLGNHVLPFRLGEALRVTSAVRRCRVGVRATTAATVTLRAGDLLALLLVGAVAAPAATVERIGGLAATLVAGGLLVLLGLAWFVLRPREQLADPSAGTVVEVAAATLLAWVLEAAVLWAVAASAGVGIGPAEAVGVTAATILAQAVAVTPGGVGTYEAAGTAALVALGVAAPAAFAVVLTTHLVKTAYSLLVGSAALVAPAPGYWGRWRLPSVLPPRPAPLAASADAPVVVFLPAHDEEATVGGVVSRIPRKVAGRDVVVVVVDDGSTDATAALAEAAGARVVQQPQNRGLGAAVRRGLSEAVALEPAAGVYLDSDDEYRPEDIAAVVAPVLDGSADYVVGSRFAGTIEWMRPHRRLGNRVLTRWVRWMTRRRDLTDGQSGFRAFSPSALAAAEVVHDYNYAQVLTLDLLGKGFAYAEVPIGYSFRRSGRSFVSLGRYLRKVLPAVHRELNDSRAPEPLSP